MSMSAECPSPNAAILATTTTQETPLLRFSPSEHVRSLPAMIGTILKVVGTEILLLLLRSICALGPWAKCLVVKPKEKDMDALPHVLVSSWHLAGRVNSAQPIPSRSARANVAAPVSGFTLRRCTYILELCTVCVGLGTALWSPGGARETFWRAVTQVHLLNLGQRHPQRLCCLGKSPCRAWPPLSSSTSSSSKVPPLHRRQRVSTALSPTHQPINKKMLVPKGKKTGERDTAGGAETT